MKEVYGAIVTVFLTDHNEQLCNAQKAWPELNF
jgi:hypothetical protein